MNKVFNHFSRVIAGALVLTVSFMSFSCPLYEPYQQGPNPLTPGMGTPSYFYLDSDGNCIETETNGPGRTGLIVEDNQFAQGVLVYSDDTDTEDRVAFVYEDSIVSMLFQKGSNFPHRMVITDGSDEYSAYVSRYNAVNHTYHVTFLSDKDFKIMDNIVLNENIFSLYQNDTELSDSQNRRMANMIIAMGVWGSLYASFNQSSKNNVGLGRWAMFGASDFFRGVAKVFSYVAIASAIVATVVAPIVSFIDPALGLALAGFAWEVARISTIIAVAAEGLANWLERQGGGGSYDDFIPLVYVSRVEPDGGEKKIRYNGNGAHEEFHINPGNEFIFKFYIPGFNTDYLPERKDMVWFDEPLIPKPNGVLEAVINLHYFTNFPPEIEKPSDNKEVFFVKFKRINFDVYGGDGKINFGIIFPFADKTGKLYDWTVNDYKDGFNFRLSGDDTPVLYKNMVVIYFCLVKDCPDNK